MILLLAVSHSVKWIVKIF